MKDIIKHILIIITCLITTNVMGQNEINSTILKLFWNKSIIPLVERDKDKIEKIVHFPLQGDWGFIMKLKTPDSLWTEKEFLENFDKLFTKEVIEKIKAQNFTDIDVLTHENGTIELLVGVDMENWTNNFRNEYGIIFRFKKIDDNWKIYSIQSTG